MIFAIISTMHTNNDNAQKNAYVLFTNKITVYMKKKKAIGKQYGEYITLKKIYKHLRRFTGKNYQQKIISSMSIVNSKSNYI